MAGWHHWLYGRESEWTPGAGDGQGGLACCDSWGREESDTTERLIWSDQFCTFKNPIFSTHFYLGVWLLARLLSPPFDSPFSPSVHFYLLHPPSLLYPTLWISVCVPGCGEHLGNRVLPRSLSLSFWFPFFFRLPLSPSSLYIKSQYIMINAINEIKNTLDGTDGRNNGGRR